MRCAARARRRSPSLPGDDVCRSWSRALQMNVLANASRYAFIVPVLYAAPDVVDVVAELMWIHRDKPDVTTPCLVVFKAFVQRNDWARELRAKREAVGYACCPGGLAFGGRRGFRSADRTMAVPITQAPASTRRAHRPQDQGQDRAPQAHSGEAHAARHPGPETALRGPRAAQLGPILARQAPGSWPGGQRGLSLQRNSATAPLRPAGLALTKEREWTCSGVVARAS